MFRTIAGNDQEEEEIRLPGPQQSWADRIKSLRNRRNDHHPVGTAHFR
jgi:hypothetical protein